MHDRITEYIAKYNLFYSSQYGFQSGRGTIDALLEVTENIRKVDEKRQPISVMLDLKKAFDTVDHACLLQKLERYGIRGNALMFLESYLVGREQVLAFNNHLSDKHPVAAGVPQGSILGPLLFLLYINDLPLSCKHVRVFIFADDTCLNGCSANEELLIQEDLGRVENWLKDNHMAANANKCEAILFGRRQHANHLKT